MHSSNVRMPIRHIMFAIIHHYQTIQSDVNSSKRNINPRDHSEEKFLGDFYKDKDVVEEREYVDASVDQREQ
jgi:hypothetical protein